MAQPKIKLEMQPMDWLLDLTGVGVIAVTFIYAFYKYPELTSTIPTHFNASGEVDGYGGKDSVWVLPSIGLVMFIGMWVLTKFPHIYNYPVKVTEDNAEKMYRNGVSLIRSLNLIVVVLFGYISYQSIETASGEAAGLGAWFLPVFLVFTLLPIPYFLIKMKRASG